jgi:hypothetical protein
MTPELADRTIRSGLDALVAIMDGATQRNYATSRKGGDLATAISNLGTFMKIRRRLRAETPRVIWRFTAYRHNEFEAKKARDLAKQLGLDGFMLSKPAASAPEWKPGDGVVPFDRSNSSFCHQIWSEPVILSDGRLMPSNNPTFGKFNVGNVRDGFHQAFNSEAFRQAREACHDHPFDQVPTLHPCNR